jgi:hypothetical protein
MMDAVNALIIEVTLVHYVKAVNLKGDVSGYNFMNYNRQYFDKFQNCCFRSSFTWSFIPAFVDLL